MGEQETKNIAFIQSLYDAFRRGDLPFILKNLSEDVKWTLEGPSVLPFAGKRTGVSQVQQFFEALASGETNQRLTIESLVAQGDQVAALGRYAATVTATGRSYDSPVAHFFTVRGGKVSRFVEVAETVAPAEAYRAGAAAAR